MQSSPYPSAKPFSFPSSPLVGGGGRGTLIAPIPAILPRQATISGQSNYSIEGSVKVNVPIPRIKTFCSSVFPPGEDTVGYIEDYKRTDDIVSRCR